MRHITKILSALLIVLFTVSLLAVPVQFLWNYCLVGAIDGVRAITFLDALGINLLTSILFKDALSNDKKDNRDLPVVEDSTQTRG